ncbi:caspase family protein [Pseudorhodoplanes sp.]|uniref:caspase family protein n=1 Tax=Pseudorhodoplanes sp. TaxID=1934341 RepID=UPI002B92AFB9|nr:caspase family protein [Pseudorhodoplanes sp.]HWV40711.1 caspase family protein [Pseudorhodoplanes sp.]
MLLSALRAGLAVAIAAGLIGLYVAEASAQTRRALVIGADDYRNVAKLQKAVGDARAMKAALEKVGFSVDILINPDRAAFNSGISEFTRKLGPGDIALIHYSGHGVALDGENYLLPVDAPRPDRVDKEGLKLESFALMPLIERVRATGSNVQIAIVDACRDNPYAQSGTRSVGRRGGLVEPSRRPVKGQGGFFILFSAGFGQTAADRLDDNDREPTSVYTRTLLRKIAVEGKPITDLAREVREDVEELAATVNHEQRPAYYDELSGPLFYFAPPRSGGAVALAPVQPQVQPPQSATPRPAQQPAAAVPVLTPQQVASLPAGPSFDCRADTKPVEQAICGDAALSARDRILSQVYYRLADRLPQTERVALRDQQRAWIGQRNGCGNAVPCIAQAYDQRIAQLQAMSGGAQQQIATLTPPPPQRTVSPQVTPSFACTGRLTQVEQAICNDPALAQRDRDLDALYKAARARPGVATGQRSWIRLRNACADTACIAQAYDRRIGELRAALR